MFRHIVPRSVKLIESKEKWSIRTYRQKQGVSNYFLGTPFQAHHKRMTLPKQSQNITIALKYILQRFAWQNKPKHVLVGASRA